MQATGERKRIRKGVEIAVVVLLCAVVVVLDFVKLPIFKDVARRGTTNGIIQRLSGSLVAIWFIFRFSLRVFGRVEKWLYILPCLLIALNNLQWCALLGGKMELVRTDFIDVSLFVLSCLLTGFYEEAVFRGILFPLLLGVFSKDKKGFLWSVVLSSLIFSLLHLAGGISLATLKQAAYCFLTGGLFVFCFVKTKNVLCCAVVHALYNFCGLLFDTSGLGNGVVFDLGTVIMMAVVGVLVGGFVLYKLWTYSNEERTALYEKLNVKNNG